MWLSPAVHWRWLLASNTSDAAPLLRRLQREYSTTLELV